MDGLYKELEFKWKGTSIIAEEKNRAGTTNTSELRKAETWNQWFPDTKQLRVYIYENTDVPLTKPSDPDLQRALFSEYYGGLCAKGGVVLQ